MKGKILLFLTLCLGFILVLGYSQSNSTENQLSFASSSGDTREVNGLEITLNEARVEAEEGEEQTVIVDLTLKNVSNDVLEFSTYKVTLVDEDGYAHNHTSDVETKGILGGQLHPDRTNRGEIAFSVPKGTNYELVYTDHLRTGQVTWEVSVEKE